jgi:hypothetical protein
VTLSTKFIFCDQPTSSAGTSGARWSVTVPTSQEEASLVKFAEHSDCAVEVTVSQARDRVVARQPPPRGRRSWQSPSGMPARAAANARPMTSQSARRAPNHNCRAKHRGASGIQSSVSLLRTTSVHPRTNLQYLIPLILTN